MLDQRGDNNINSIIGIVLIFIILIGYSIYTQPTEEQIAEHKRKRDSIAAIEQELRSAAERNQPVDDAELSNADEGITAISDDDEAGIDSILQNANIQRLGSFANAATGTEEFFTIENELIKVILSTLGGRVHSVELKNYQTHDSLPLMLFTGDSSELSLNFFADNRSIVTKELFFEPRGESFEVSEEKSNSFSMRLIAGEYTYLEYQYTLQGNSYELGFNINMVGLDDVIASNTGYMNIDWGIYVPSQEKSLSNERINTTIYYKYLGDEVDYLSETSDEREDLKTKVKWVAFKQQFFSSILVAEEHFESPTYIETITNEDATSYVKQMLASFTIPYNHSPKENFRMTYYFGPNHYQDLKVYEQDFEEIIPLGWGIFGWVNIYLIIPIFNFLDNYINSYGIIILIMTIFIKILLFPLMYKSYQSTAKMRVLKPEIDALSEKFPKKDDAMKKQQAVMALYKKTGVNPLGGCFPMLVQMPILIAMYRFFPSSIELRQQSFLWADDLSSYDSIYDFPGGFSIPFYGDHVSLFTLLMTAATLLSVKMNTEMSGGSHMQMPQMKVMMYMMPVMFLGFFNSFAAALSYYYFVATMITFGQQYLMRKFIDEDAILKKIDQQRKKPAPKKSSFQKRLEKMAREKGYKG